MDPIEKQERKHDARRRLRAQRRRAGELRGRVVAISLIAFVLLWGVVFAQMATGNDPVLGSSSSTTTGSNRGGAGSRSQSTPKATPPEAEAGTDAEEEAEPEFVEPEPVETEVLEPEAIEPEVVEAEPEPAPVITSQ